jgi:sulfoxide reductase heme-binding subunit YedZ
VSRRARIALKVVVWGAALAPLAALAWWTAGDDLTANPISFVTNHLGDWTFRILLTSLAMTPLRILTGWGWPALLRRLLGLFAFVYAGLHFGVWILLDHFLNWGQMLEDIVKRPYVTVGMAALLLMVPLAATSTAGMVKRLGGLAWRRLHRLVYAVAVLAALHFLWLAKVGRQEQYVYAGLVALLLAIRLGDWARRRVRGIRRPAAQRGRRTTEPRRSFFRPPTAQAGLAAPATATEPAPGHP